MARAKKKRTKHGKKSGARKTERAESKVSSKSRQPESKPGSKSGQPESKHGSQSGQPESKHGSKPKSSARNPSSARERQRGSRSIAAMLAALIVLAAIVTFGVRSKITPAEDHVFGGSEVVLVGADSYYHLRHTRAAVSNGIQRWDIGTHYPHGQRSRNAALFDSIGAIATAAVAESSPPSDDDVATVLAWLPPIMAGLVLVGLFAVGLALGSKLLGLTMAACAAAYPGEMAFKMLLGFADHHALEAVLLTLTTAGLAAALRAREPRHAATWAAATGVSLAILGLTWAGAALLLPLLVFAPLVVAAIDLSAGREPTRARRVGATAMGTFAIITALAAVLSPDAILVPALGWLSVAGAGVVCAAFGLSGPLVAWLLAGSSRRRLLSLGLVAAPPLLLAVAALASQSIGDALRVAFNKAGSVAEHQGPSPWLLYGPLIPLAVVGALATLVSLARNPSRRGEAGVAVFAASVALMHLYSGDYGYLAAPMFAVLAALAAARIVSAAGRTPELRRRWRPAAGIAVAVMVFAPVAMGWTNDPAADERTVEAMIYYDDAWQSATTWLREDTDPTIDIDDSPGAFTEWGDGFPYPSGSYGVAVPWSFGNFVAAKGRRPVTWSQGINRDLAELYTAPSEADALARLCGGCKEGERVRYLIVDAQTTGPQAVSLFEQAGKQLSAKRLQRRLIIGGRRLSLASYGPRFHQSLAARLYLEDGDGLGHFRLAYETPEERLVGYRYRVKANSYGRIAQPVTDDNRARLERMASAKLPMHSKKHGFVYDAELQPAIKIFEVVRGATMTGTASPGAEITARATIEGPAGDRTFIYSNETTADNDGDFELTVPYPTADGGDRPHARSAYRLQLGENTDEITVRVSRRQVRDGRRIKVRQPGGDGEPTATIGGVGTGD